MIRKKALKAIEEYNSLKGAESVAKLAGIENGSLRVFLSGHFCRTCGVHDYFDDLKLILERIFKESFSYKATETKNGYSVEFFSEDLNRSGAERKKDAEIIDGEGGKILVLSGF